MTTFWTVFAIVWALAGFGVLWLMAAQRGRDRWAWGLFGLFTFVIAVLFILIAGPTKQQQPPPAVTAPPR